jgi:hypothetical protein
VMLTLMATADNAFAAPKPKITSPTTDSGTIGVPYSYQITADQAITIWGATPLPAGLTVNTTTGLISGTPSATGTTSVDLDDQWPAQWSLCWLSPSGFLNAPGLAK